MKAVRLRHAVLWGVLVAAVYWTSVHPWMSNWGATPAERQTTLPGDELNPDPAMRSTLAITIDAPAAVGWQWLVQIGQDRAGFYSYTWLENIVGADIHNAGRIHPEWQNLDVGDGWRLVASDYLWGVGNEASSPVLIVPGGHRRGGGSPSPSRAAAGDAATGTGDHA